MSVNTRVPKAPAQTISDPNQLLNELKINWLGNGVHASKSDLNQVLHSATLSALTRLKDYLNEAFALEIKTAQSRKLQAEHIANHSGKLYNIIPKVVSISHKRTFDHVDEEQSSTEPNKRIRTEESSSAASDNEPHFAIVFVTIDIKYKDITSDSLLHFAEYTAESTSINVCLYAITNICRVPIHYWVG
jgi:hypothetical protein